MHAATSACLTLGSAGWVSNLIVYMIGEFNVKRIDAAQGTVLLTLTSAIDSLRPQPCETGSIACPTPSKFQLTILYAGLALSSLGIGGMRFTLTTMGANQYTTAKEQSIYFNWYFFSMYASAITASTAIVYVEDNVSWAWGFGLCAAANALGLAIFLFGSRFYRHVKPEGSPFTGLVQVFVASIRKRKAQISLKSDDYCRGGHDNGIQEVVAATPTTSFREAGKVELKQQKKKAQLQQYQLIFPLYWGRVGSTMLRLRMRFLNRAALIAQGDISSSDGSIAKPWNLCTLQQVEDLKTLIRIFPLWSSSIFLGTPIGIQTSLLVLQALTMDRRLGPHFTIPAGSMLVSVSFFVCIALILSDRLIRPTWQYLAGRPPTPLQLIGVGHVLNIASMAVSAVVESKRRRAAVPMSVFWLVPQLAIVGVGEAFHFPGQVALYYQEFPASLKNMATAAIGLLIGIAFYLSTAVIGCVRTATGWLPDDIDDGKVDYVFWMLVVVGVVNFGYYTECAVLYKYRNLERVVAQPH
ncbi:hypothetical protein RHGRI_036476 [Rhododendron griersonianum]|uniref:Uncharacterized protein n=1 Tax=Rhododendron griersonianum TaxID=479676 RepID=A0AAV6HNL4_9ERIC|nr:hypothetical protein RHGRI_036476 [Rhododendron griersonianum]